MTKYLPSTKCLAFLAAGVIAGVYLSNKKFLDFLPKAAPSV